MRVVSAIILALWPISLLAAPTISGISGTVSSGQSITISGSDFGTKSTPTPIKWDNFESGEHGGTISGWDLTYGNNVKYSNVGNRTGSSLCYAAGVTTADDPSNANASNSRITLNSGISATKIFASYWIKWNWGEITGGQIKHGVHLCREYPGSSAPRINTVLYYSNNNPYWQGTGTYTPGFCSSGIDSCTLWGSANMYPTDTWVQVEVQIEQSTADLEDGSLISWVGKSTGAMVKVVNFPGNICLRKSDADYNYAQINVWTWAGNDEGDGYSTTIYYDDFYVDNTWARVVIGDASTYDNCTRREVQIPTAWDTGEITVTINQGSFGATDTAYLYVVDDDGTPSSSYEITFGESAAPTTSKYTITGGKCNGCQ